MRLTVRLMGLDVVDVTLDTDIVEYVTADAIEGDSTAYPVGFALPEAPTEYAVPDRYVGE